MRVNSRWRQPVADHDREFAGTSLAAREPPSGSFVQPPTEIRTPQIVATIAGAAMNLACDDAETGKLRDQRLGIESGMNGIARARVIQRKVEQSAGGQARTCATERDARRG
jgi:hypothetical protein